MASEVIPEWAFPECRLELLQGTAVEYRCPGFADAEQGCYLRDAALFGVDAVELRDNLLFRGREASQGFVDALQLSRAEPVFVVLLFLLPEGFLLQTVGSPVAVNGHEHHLPAPVGGIRREAASHRFIVAHGGFAQAEATLLPQVFLTDAAVSHPPCHRVCQGHVADDEQAARIGECCHFVFLNILSHFLLCV